jgi:hypothetical protein
MADMQCMVAYNHKGRHASAFLAPASHWQASPTFVVIKNRLKTVFCRDSRRAAR